MQKLKNPVTYYRPVNRWALKVLNRNLIVFRKTWPTNIVFNIIEPLLYLAAMGVGLGALLDDIEGMSYIQFIAPGLVATSAMWAAAAECSYDSFVRMYYHKIYHAIVATPISIEEVVVGELLFGTFKSLLSGTVIISVIAVLGLVLSPWALLVPIVLVLNGLVFSQIAMIWTGLVPKIDSFAYFFTLVITPMFLFSGVFFPMEVLPEILQQLAWVLPLYHVVTLVRSLALGAVSVGLFYNVLVLLAIIIITFPLPQILMHRRLIK
jgi:lipooligosaccharide transport system permease protein